MLWQTDEVRSIRPSVDDEIRQGLWFFEASLLDVGADLVARLDEELPGLGTLPLQFGTWIGGDQDGNPNATPDQIGNALARARTLALRRYRGEVRELARAIGVSDTLVQVDDALRASIERDEQEMPWVQAETAVRNEHEPYRRKLTAIWRRLDNELSGRDEPGYARASELAADLDLVDASLRHHLGARIADGRLAALRRRVAVFGLHVARLDVRVHADQVRAPDDRLRATFAAVREAQRVHGVEALDTLVLSGTESAQDVLAANDLAEQAGLRPLGRAPLRDHRRPRARARDPRRAARRTRLRPTARRARAQAHRDGRLLGLGQGRRLPGSAVGDPRGTRRARARRGRARHRADGVPRPRRQHRARRRADAPRDPRPAPAARRRTAADHRAGRDDRLQVRPAGSRPAQPRAGARGDPARLVPRGREHLAAQRGRERDAGARSPLARGLLGVRARRGVPRVLPPLHADRRARAARDRLAARAAAREAAASCPGCAPFRGSSPGRRTAACCPPGTASAPRSARSPTPRRGSAACAACIATGRSSGRSWRTSR